MNLSRGSEWHKWDYHVHTPASFHYEYKAADAFDKIIAAINGSDHSAYGINDYNTIDGYLQLRGKVNKLIFPVVEFRMQNIVAERGGTAGPSINFHILFTDEDEYLEKIKSFLLSLQFQDFNQHMLNFTDREFIRLGKQFLPEETDENTLRMEGLSKIKVDFFDVLKARKEKGLQEKSIVIIPYDEYGGIDEIDPVQDGLLKSGFIKQSDVIGSGSSGQRDYFLGKAKKYTEDQFKLWIGKPKPCIKGSDSHHPDTIGKLPTAKDGAARFCWIKADPTFEGLKHILYEPQERVHIGVSPPDEKDTTKVIRSLRIENSNGWFEDTTIPLNRDLVTIIGGKGSGKTALVDLLGYTGGNFDASDQESFLYKAKSNLESTSISVEWESGEVHPFELKDTLMPQPSAKVRYLSQSFVKSLCSFDQHERLVEQIENILFQYVPATDTLGAKKFVELKSKKAEGIQLEISKLASKLQAFNKEIVDLETEIASKDDLVSEKEELEVEREELLKQRPKPVSAQEEADEKALSDLKKKKDDFETQISDRRIKISKLELLQTKAALVLNEIQSFNDEAKAVFAEIGEPSGSETVSIPVPVHIETALAAKITELSNEVSAIEGSEEADGEKETLKSVEAKIQEIEERREIEMERKTKLQEFDLRIAAIDQRLKTLTSSIQLIESKKQGELDTKVKERDAEFLRFFTLLERKKQILQALYEPLSKTAGGNGERGKVEFSAEYSFNHKRFASDGLVVFDRRKSAIRDEQELRECGKRYWDKMKGTLHAPSLQPLLDLEREMEPNAEERPIAAQLRGEYGILDFYHWLYSVEYYDVEYGIKYEGTDLQKLSPGRKGVVLLLIYLDIDKDYRPLIIDQPEENLDNRSVYSTLVEYFRKAKKKRQIIIVTHNANLVVNGDAEQVIVANFEVEPTTQPTKIKYVCGSLENSRATDRNVPNILERQGIREHVCEVLEGGDVAFKKREDKYGFA